MTAEAARGYGGASPTVAFHPSALMRLPRAALAAVAAALLAACSGTPTAASNVTPLSVLDRVPTGDQTADAAALDSARRAVRALAASGTCASGGCASLAMGAKPCGGPWEYVPYCPTSPDAERLRTMAADLTRVEQAYNARYGILSTCDIARPNDSCPLAP